jgi:hypothetical protein
MTSMFASAARGSDMPFQVITWFAFFLAGVTAGALYF